MIRHLRTGLMTASILALSSGAAFADYELNILHINDLHSRIESINKSDSTCSAEEEGKDECFGGVARLKTEIERKRGEWTGRNVVLLNAGDNFQGSLFFTTYKGAAEAEFLNLMKFDAMTVGNHEFDEGEDGLTAFLDKVTFPVISSNVLPGFKSKLKDRIKPSIVLDIGGQKIGVVGAVANDTPEISAPGDEVLIGLDVDTITTAVQELKAQGVNKIIALTHVGYPRDLAVIAKIPDVDIVVGGHSHSLLSNTDDKAEGPYPTMVDNPGGYKVPVVQAGSYSKYLGDLVVDFDDNGVVKSAKGDPILLDSKVKPDETVLARIKELGKPIEEVKTKIIGKTEAAIDGTRESCRAKECEMGDLVADAMLDRVKDQGVTIAITNGGGLRASIDAGDVSMGEAITVLPFQNTVATFQLKGADILTALENGLSQIEEGGGRFPQVAGMKFSFDKSKPVGSRVSVVEVKEGEAYAPLDANKTYTLVSNNYMRNGGDGYSIFKTKAVNAYDYGPGLETVLADYLTAHNPYTPKTDGRITEIAAATPAEPSTQTSTDPAANTDTAAKTVTPDAKPAEPATTTTETATPETKPATETPATTTSAANETKHVIVRGDTLWDLAKALYGDAELWKKIAEANGNPVPERLEIGAELTIPAR